jgi:hypothetical protein
MTETNKLKESKYNNSQIKNKAPTQPKSEEFTPSFPKKVELTTLKGITTSQINQALKATNPYPARVFLKVENEEQDIPVFFRIKDNQGNYIRPKIKTGSLIEVQGHFSIGTVYIKNSERKSFTTTSYTLLSCPHSQKKPYFCPIDCPCLKGKEVLNQQTQQQVLTHE